MTVLDIDGGDTIPTIQAERDNAYDKKHTARVEVARSLLDFSQVETSVTEVWLKDDSGTARSNAFFGGVIRDVDRQGGSTEILLDSFERRAIDAVPTAPNLVYGPASDDESSGVADSTIVSDAISNVPELSQGTVNTFANPISISFNSATRAKQIREVANITGAAVRYNPDKTVDYIDSLGSDRTGITLSPANQNIKGEFSADRRSGPEAAVTHLRVLGAGEGESQLLKNIVPADDSQSYESQVTYSNPSWSNGDPAKWFVQSNKDIDRSNALEEYGLSLIDDITGNKYIDVSTTIDGVSNVRLGDTFTVTYPEENLSGKVLQVVENTAKYTGTGVEYDVTLSSRRVSRKDKTTENRKDIERFNQSAQGVAVPINASGGRQPVDPQNNYQMSLYYPDEVIEELRLNVRVVGLPYRAYARGSASGASTIGNEIPLDRSFTEGRTTTFVERFSYPGIGEADTSPDSLIYEGGNTGGDRFRSDSINTGVANVSAQFSSASPTDELNAELIDNRTSGGSNTVREALWGQLDSVDVTNFSTLEIDWSGSVDGGNESLASVSVVVSDSSSNFSFVADAAQQFQVVTGGTSSFSNVTDTLSVGSLSGRKSIRVHATIQRTANESANCSANTTVTRLEYFQ